MTYKIQEDIFVGEYNVGFIRKIVNNAFSFSFSKENFIACHNDTGHRLSFEYYQDAVDFIINEHYEFLNDLGPAIQDLKMELKDLVADAKKYNLDMNKNVKTIKVVINSCYGGFGLSEKAKELYKCIAGKDYPDDFLEDRDINRTDETLIKVVEFLGKDASSECAELKIVEVPSDVDWYIEYYDGIEHVAEKHRVWN